MTASLFIPQAIYQDYEPRKGFKIQYIKYFPLKLQGTVSLKKSLWFLKSFFLFISHKTSHIGFFVMIFKQLQFLFVSNFYLSPIFIISEKCTSTSVSSEQSISLQGPFIFFVDFFVLVFWLYWWGDWCCRRLYLCMLTFARWVFRLVVWNFFYRMFVMTILKMNNFSKIYVLNEK